MNALLEFFNEKISSRFSNREFNTPRLRNNGQSAFDYDFMMSLDYKDYPKYLCQAYYIKTGEKLNLKHPKTINEKIQWLKIYDNLPIKTTLTDKVLVQEWVKEKIGEEYLKPVLQICNSFDEINFENLPDSFIIKCNHGCKWHFIIKEKENYLKNEVLYALSDAYIRGWLSQTFFGWSDFETQYKNIEPKIIIEPLLREDLNKGAEEIEVWCFNGEAKIIQSRHFETIDKPRVVSCYDENYNPINLKFLKEDIITQQPENKLIRKATELSKILAKDFKLARVDWLVYKEKLYFEEITFTPLSGFITFTDEYKNWNLKLGNMLNLKGKYNV